MHKALLAIFVALALIFSAGPSQAQFAGTCTTADGPCSRLVDQIAQYARQLLQLIQETITATQEVLNTTPLGGMQFQDITAEIQQLTQIAKQADLLVGHPGDFIGNLNAPYYPLPENGMQQTIYEQNSIGNAIKQLGNVVNTVNPSLAQRAATLASLTTEALQAIGRMQNQQDTHQALVTTGQDVHALTNLTLTMAQAQHTQLLAQHDQKAMNDAWADQMATSYSPLPSTGPGY